MFQGPANHRETQQASCWRKWDIIGSSPTRGRGTSLLLAGDAMMEVVGDNIGVSLLMDISIAMDAALFHLSTSKESI